jgi:hypothetical protein
MLSLSPPLVRRRDDHTLLKEETMKYALLIYSSEAPEEFAHRPEDEQRAIVEEYLAVQRSPGVYAGEQLQPAESATTVRVENGQTLTTDGPFPEMKEIFGGLMLLEADNLDEALEVAARLPAARMGGAVEVRPIVER